MHKRLSQCLFSLPAFISALIPTNRGATPSKQEQSHPEWVPRTQTQTVLKSVLSSGDAPQIPSSPPVCISSLLLPAVQQGSRGWKSPAQECCPQHLLAQGTRCSWENVQENIPSGLWSAKVEGRAKVSEKGWEIISESWRASSPGVRWVWIIPHSFFHEPVKRLFIPLQATLPHLCSARTQGMAPLPEGRAG